MLETETNSFFADHGAYKLMTSVFIIMAPRTCWDQAREDASSLRHAAEAPTVASRRISGAAPVSQPLKKPVFEHKTKSRGLCSTSKESPSENHSPDSVRRSQQEGVQRKKEPPEQSSNSVSSSTL